MADCILALDAGTTGITAVVYGQEGSVSGQATSEFTQHFPRPGWVEHDAMEILEVARKVCRKALADAGIAAAEVAGRVAAMGITNQRETIIVWDKQTGKPIHHAIVWQDRRTSEVCDKLRRRHEKTVRAKTGLRLDPYFSATKLAWVLDHVKGARDDAVLGKLLAGTVDTWLAWKLTGQHVTDPTNASRTSLWNIHDSVWDQDLLDLFEVPAAGGLLPEVVPSSHIVGDTDVDFLGASVPLAALVGDQQAALWGQGCHEAGHAKNSYGTGCFLLQHTGDEARQSKHGLLTTRAASVDDTPRYALEGSVFVGGAAIQWLRDGLGLIKKAPEIDRLAAKADPDSCVVFVPAFAGLGAPHWDADARGALLGLTRGTGPAELAQATLEGIAAQCTELIDAMQKDAGTKLKVLRVDGGAAGSDRLLQLQADLARVDIDRPDSVEMTARGAAWLAGIAAGVCDAENFGLVGKTKSFKPKMGRRDAKAHRKRWGKAVKAVRAFKP